MPTAANEQTVDTLSIEDIKNVGGMGPIAAGLSTQNAVSGQQRMQAILEDSLQQTLLLSRGATSNALAFSQAMIARASRFLLDTSAEEAVAFAKQVGSDLSAKLAEFGAGLASLQEQAKIAQTTPPQTGTGGAFGSDAGSALMQQIVNQLAVLAAEVESLKAAKT